MAWCAGIGDFAEVDNITYGEFSAQVAELFAAAKAVNPPAEVADLHARIIFLFRSLMGVLDEQPGDDVVDPFILFAVLFPAGLVQEAGANLAPDIQARLVDAGCIDGPVDVEPTPVAIVIPTQSPAAPATPAPEAPVATPEPVSDDDHGDWIDGATAIAVGEAVEGEVNYGGDADVFGFQAEKGVFYQIDVELGTLEDSWLALFDSDEWELAYNEDHGGSFASRIVWTAPSSGEYYVMVGGYGTGSYTLTVAVSDIVDDHANSIDSATPAMAGDVVHGVLDYDGDEDFFVFDAEEGVTYQIDAGLGTLEDSWLTLLDSDEWELAYNDDRPDSLASRIVWTTPNSGQYYVAVGGYGAGSYTLTVAVSDIVDDHGDSVAAATATAVDEPVEGALDYDGDEDVFAFDAQEGVIYQIDVDLGTLEDSWLTLLDSDEWDLAYNDDFKDSRASSLVWRTPSSGEYYVAVGGYGTGSYTLTVAVSDIVDDHGDSVAAATAAALGEPVEGVLDYDGDEDFFAFTAEAGLLYQIDVAPGTLDDSEVVLLDADDWWLANNDDFGDSPASRIVWYAESSGNYYVAVNASWGSDTGTGSYTLTVAVSDIVDDHGDSVAAATAAAVGEPVEGVLDYDGDEDVFAFEAQEGVIYQVDVALGTLEDSRLELQDADGWRLEYNDDFGDSRASSLVWRAPSSGEYYVAVGGYGAGSYTLTITQP